MSNQTTQNENIYENVLIQDCLKQLKESEYSRNLFNSLDYKFSRKIENCKLSYESFSDNKYNRAFYIFDGACWFENFEDCFKIDFILTMLSRTQKSELLMPFLDKEINLDNGNGYFYEKKLVDHLREVYVEICFGKGQGHDKAFEEITDIYIKFAK